MRGLIYIVPFFLTSLASGQSTDITTFFMSNPRKAEIYFGKLAYKNALELYERVLEKNPNNLKAIVRVAECYVHLNDPEVAASYYKSAVARSEIAPIQKYNYAQVLLSLGNYEEARFWLNEYRLDAPDDSRVPSKLKFLDNMNYYLRDSNLYFLQSLPLNSPNSDFGAIKYGDGLAFLSSRDDDLFIKYTDDDENSISQAPFDFYTISLSDSGLAEPKKIHGTLNTKFHEGPAAFFNDGKRIIFTRSNYLDRKKKFSSDGKINLQLFLADSDEKEGWVNIRPFPYNNPDYSTAHPALSTNNLTLYFSSDMPGGYGGGDIYYCKWENNSWSSPVNAGPHVNTRGEEVYPFFSDDGHLYFSSDGHGGFGGLDTYRATNINGVFGHIENLGFPMNTSRDDFSFTLDENGRTGFISSNRPGGVGNDDIYQIQINFKTIVGEVLDSRTRERVPNAKVTVYDSVQHSFTQVTSNENGLFYFDLPLDSDFDLDAEKPGYSPELASKVSSFVESFQTDTIPVLVWKHELFAQGRVFSNETQKLQENVTVTLDNLTDNIVTTLNTKADGTYSFIIRPNKLYLIQAEKPDHIPGSFRLNTEGMIADTLLNDFVLEEMYVDKDVIFFDFDETVVKPDAIPSLDQMVSVLRKHKNTYIVVSAHADAQGTFEYNQALSNRRALAVVAYLKQKGIKEGRITWRGFGEQLLINRCSDGVECPDEEHSKNRRAELKIEENKPDG